jgi:predicted Na+-dependent transporter
MGLALTIPDILASVSNVRLMPFVLAVNFRLMPALACGAAGR